MVIKYKIRDSDWLKFPLIIVNFNHFFIQPAPGRAFLILYTAQARENRKAGAKLELQMEERGAYMFIY